LLREWKFEVTVPPEIAERDRGAIDRMIAIS
jgi:quinolinate synthase